MNKEELNIIIRNSITTEDHDVCLFPFWWDDYDFSSENLEKLIYDNILPKVLNSVIPNDNDIDFKKLSIDRSSWQLDMLKTIKQKIRELYDINL